MNLGSYSFDAGFTTVNVDFFPFHWQFGPWIDEEYEKEHAHEYDAEGYCYERQVSKSRFYWVGPFCFTTWTR